MVSGLWLIANSNALYFNVVNEIAPHPPLSPSGRREGEGVFIVN